MRMSIEWHKQCLKNKEKSLQRNIDKQERAKQTAIIARRNILIYRNQIITAQLEHKEGFDEDTYLINRGKKK